MLELRAETTANPTATIRPTTRSACAPRNSESAWPANGSLTRSIATVATLCCSGLPSNASVARHPPAPKSCNGLRYDGAIEAGLIPQRTAGRWHSMSSNYPRSGGLTDLLFARSRLARRRQMVRQRTILGLRH
jgi:hypothetical protein